ncbi:MAG: DUF2110 family protein [Candidatus Bathyarchaeia archaeon]
MTTLTLIEKIPQTNLNEVEYALSQLLRSLSLGLNVNFALMGLDESGHLSIEVGGEDAEVLTSLLSRNLVLTEALKMPPPTNYILKATVKEINSGEAELLLDLGSSVYEGSITKEHLKAYLLDGRDLPLPALADLFCLNEGVPVEVRVVTVDECKRRVYVEFTSLQLLTLMGWISDLLERVVVVGVTRRQIKNALAKAGSLRKIVKIERLGFLSHAIPCKLGYPASSIETSLKKALPLASTYLFSPKNIVEHIVNRKL